MNSNHCQLFTILIGFRTASPRNNKRKIHCFDRFGITNKSR